MRGVITCVAMLLIVGADVGCAHERVDKTDTAKAWLRAVNGQDWHYACSLLASPPPDCERGLRDRHEGRKYKLLPANAYQNGARPTDNRTFFAMLADNGSLFSFDVIRADGAEKVRQVTFFGPPVKHVLPR
jgi:hypothetical protein